MDELKEKYRSLPFWARILMAFIIGILPGACSYLEEAEVLEGQLGEAQQRETLARNKFEDNRKEKANIPKLEEELAYTEEQLEKAKKKLPEGYLVENVLTLAASSARSAGVILRKFSPTCELKGVGEFKYVEFPINVEIAGKFQQIASFLDKIVHAEMMVFVRQVSVTLGDLPQLNLPADTPEYEVSVQIRKEHLLKAEFQMVVFRGMKDEEEAFFENKTTCDEVAAADPNIAPGEAVNLPQPAAALEGAQPAADGGVEAPVEAAPPP